MPKESMPNMENEAVIRTATNSTHMNPNGQVFGGWIFSQMDYASGLTGEHLTRGRVATVAAKEVNFIKPILGAEMVSVYCREVEFGNTSLHISLEVISEIRTTGEKKLVATGKFVLVAIDENGLPRPIQPAGS